jgi:hypothetical protein
LWTDIKGTVLPVQATETHLRIGIINLLIRELKHRELEGDESSYSTSSLKRDQTFYWRMDRHFEEKKSLLHQSRIEPRLNVLKPVEAALHWRL